MKSGPRTLSSSNRAAGKPAHGRRWRQLISLVVCLSFAAENAFAAEIAASAQNHARAEKSATKRAAGKALPAAQAKPPRVGAGKQAHSGKKQPASARAGKRRPHAKQGRGSRRNAGLLRAPSNTPAARYAELDAASCHAELRRRNIPFRVEATAPGVKIPIRFTGPVAGVLYRSDLPDKQRAHAPWEVFDCRLALSVADFSAILKRHDVHEVRIFSAWRPPPKRAGSAPARRHPGALAMDVRALKRSSGADLVVLDHFDGRLGEKVCDANRQPESADARELLAIVCEVAGAHVFNSILTPNYDSQHQNHFHLELTPSVSWFMLR